jgi:hypothetical protein
VQQWQLTSGPTVKTLVDRMVSSEEWQVDGYVRIPRHGRSVAVKDNWSRQEVWHVESPRRQMTCLIVLRSSLIRTRPIETCDRWDGWWVDVSILFAFAVEPQLTNAVELQESSALSRLARYQSQNRYRIGLWNVYLSDR